MKIFNATRGRYLAERAERAVTWWQRGFGLMGWQRLPEDFALVIDPCRSVHMCFMRVALDVVHVDSGNRVVRILHDIQPWRLGPLVWRGRYVVELPSGTANKTGTQPGDQLVLDE